MQVIPPPEDLREAADVAHDELREYRDERARAFEEFCGRFYAGSEDKDTRRYLNLINRAVSVIAAHLIQENPRHEINPDDQMMAWNGTLQALLLDRLVQIVGRKDNSRLALLDALMGPMGIIQTGINAGDELVAMAGKSFPRGTPYEIRVPFDDYVCDMAARSDAELRWEGVYRRILKGPALESGIYDNELLERLPTIGETIESKRGRPTYERGLKTSRDMRHRLFQEVEVLDVFLYGDGQTIKVTLPASECEYDGYLREVLVDGPRRPLTKLRFGQIPDKLMPLPPVAQWREQAEAFYVIVGKLITQIDAIKSLLLVKDDTDEDEVAEVRDSEDNGVLYVRDPSAYNTLDVGKVRHELEQASQMVYQWFNVSSSNIDILGGAGANTDKATIFAGLSANANAMVEDLQSTHDNFQDELSDKLRFWATNDPFMQMPLTYRAPGGETFNLTYDARTMQGDFNAMRLRIKRQSMGRIDPGMRAQQLQGFLGLILEGAQIAQVTGGYLNLQGLARIGAKALGMDEIESLVNDPILVQEQAAISAMVPPPVPGQPVPSGVNPAAVAPQQSTNPASLASAAQRGIAPVRSAMQTGRPQPARRTA